MAKRKAKRISKPQQSKSQGLGDDIEKITKATGIKKAVEMFTPKGKDCGCQKRKETLNRLFPRNKPNCFTQEQYDEWSGVRKRVQETHKLVTEDRNTTIKLLKAILNMSVSGNGCSSCGAGQWLKYIDMLNRAHDTYEGEK